MGVLDGKLGDVDASNAGGASLDGLSAEDAALFRQMENGGVDDGDNGGPGDDGDNGGADNDVRDPDWDSPGGKDEDGADGEADPLDQPLRLPGDKREQLEADGDDDKAGADADRDEDLPRLTDNQQTVSAGRFRRETKKLHDKLKAAQAQLASGGPLAEELRKERDQRIALETKFNMVIEAINTRNKAAEAAKKTAEEEDPEPDIEAAPFEHQAWMNRQLKALRQENAELRSGQKKVEETHVAEQESRTLEQSYVAACQEYAQTDETFAVAYRHLQNSRFAEIADAKFGKDIYSDAPEHKLTPQEVQAVRSQFQREEQHVASQELNAQRNPAHRIMRMARARGFDQEAAKKAIADWKTKQNGGKQPDGKAPPAKRSVTEEVKGIAERRAASKSLSDGGSAPSNGKLTLRQVADMPKNEFDALLNRLGRDGYDEALLGKESV